MPTHKIPTRDTISKGDRERDRGKAEKELCGSHWVTRRSLDCGWDARFDRSANVKSKSCSGQER